MAKKIKQVDIESEQHKQMLNDLETYASTFATGFVSNLFSKGIINDVTAEQLKSYFSSPDEHQEEIEDLANYFYVSTAEIHQLFELIEALPTLNFKIDSFENPDASESHIKTIKKVLHKNKHKRLTRDLMKQTAAAGTLIGIWLGDKKSPYPFIFDGLKYVQPSYRRNGEWVCTLDMSFFDNISDNDAHRKDLISNFHPYITYQDYQNFKKDTVQYKFKELPQHRTFCLRTGTLKRNQSLGTSWVAPGLYDVLHKKKLKDVEQSIANKIINAVAVLTIGTDKNNGEYSNQKLPKPIKQKIHSGVKQALEKNQTDGVTVVSIPDYASLDFPDVKADGLDGKKFDHINNDIQSAYGLSGSMLNGEGGNYATSSLNLDTFYKRIGVLLEDIEQEVYQKLFNLILPKNQSDNYYIVYDKEKPLTLKEKVDLLLKLNDKGWSIKHVVDNIPGVSWESYLDQTLHETETLHLQDKIKPYQTSYTFSGNDPGNISDDSSTNENTLKTKSSDGNNTP